MLDNFSGVVQPENIDARPVTIFRPPLEAVEDNEVSLGNDAFEFHVLSRILASHAPKIFDKRFLAVADPGVVLRVRRSHLPLHSFVWS